MFYLSPVDEAEVDQIMPNFRDSAIGGDGFKPSVKGSTKFL